MSIVVRTVIALACGAFLNAACDRQNDARQNSLPDVSPRQTVEKLIAARKQARYQTFADLVVQDRAADLITTLMAVDEFLSADKLLCDYVRERFAPGLAQAVEQSRMAEQLGVFSRYVRIVSEHVDGDSAYVAFTVDDRIPLQRARLSLINDKWRYDPGEGYDPQLPEAFKQMAKGLRQVLEDLQSGNLDESAVKDDPEKLIEEIRLRLSAGIKLLPKPDAQGAPAEQNP